LSPGFRGRLGVIAAFSLLFAAAYLLAVTIGLPGLGGVGEASPVAAPTAHMSDHTEGEATGFLGPVEMVGEAGVFTVAVEFGAAALALGLLRPRNPTDRRSSRFDI
jgi:hypothetical protein